ncbi:unnamed protein product [Linum tenue]|uniref:Uncharacterized protein n=1 Tax=Linum tenue TaxID=586396 RepID=A0AAV0RIF3_9ROSI|nr:unnamed protein product [Linum tenue]CAI0556314.1 unnamed protein product [Linum tenue]
MGSPCRNRLSSWSTSTRCGTKLVLCCRPTLTREL